MEVRPTAVVELSLPTANAFAFIANRRIGATDAALAVLEDEELMAVCAHEMGHLSEPGRVRVGRIAHYFLWGLLVAIPAATRPVLLATDPQPGWLFFVWTLLLIFLVGMMLHSRVARRMEIRADGIGKQFEPAPGSYARALEKLYATNMVPLVARGKKHAHPELYDRLVDAGMPPEFPRPSPPSQWPLLAGLLVVLVGAAAGWFGLDWLTYAVTNRH